MHIRGLHVQSSKISQIIFVLTFAIFLVRMLLFTSVFFVMFLMKLNDTEIYQSTEYLCLQV